MQSNVIHANKDAETETTEEKSFFLALKRFKRKSIEVEVPSRVKSWVEGNTSDGFLNETSGNDHCFYQVKRTPPCGHLVS